MIRQPAFQERNITEESYESEKRNLQKLNDALDGIELTRAEERSLLWLAGWETSTVSHFISAMEKVVRKRTQ